MSAARRPSPQKKNAPADAPTSREQVSSAEPSTAQKMPPIHEPVNVTVSEIVRSPDGSQRISALGGGLTWSLSQFADNDEPRIRDIDLAERLGFERPRAIRQIIERHAEAGNISPFHRHTVERWNAGRKGAQVREREVTEYWLTLEEALFITTQSETKNAVRITKVMIAVFAAIMRGQLEVSAKSVAAAPASFSPDDLDGIYRGRWDSINAELDRTLDVVVHWFPKTDRIRLRGVLLQLALGHADTGGAGREYGFWDESTYLDIRSFIRGFRSLPQVFAEAVGDARPRRKLPKKGGSGNGGEGPQGAFVVSASNGELVVTTTVTKVTP